MLQTMAYALSQLMPQAVIPTGLMVSTCSIFQQDGNFGTSGAPSGNYNVPVITNISCMDAVPREGTIEATEMKQVKEVQSAGYRHVLLSGPYYAQLFPLIQQGLRASITDPEGTTMYEVFGVEPDSQDTMTRLHLDVISV